MGNQDPSIATAYGTQYGRIGYGPGSSPETETVYAKATVETDGAGKVIVHDSENVALADIALQNIRLRFSRSFEDADPNFSVLVTPQSAGGGAGVADREFHKVIDKASDRLSLTVWDLAGAQVDLNVTIRSYTILVFGRRRVRG